MIMKFVKLFVLVISAIVVQSYWSGYCEICRNHTLCKYSVGGPSANCKGLDKGAFLTDGDILDIVSRINSRRNLVALGRLKRFPQAANMRKVRWSTELASFAQRWADQCDPSVRPNKEDECRDLVGMQVGQSIATVLGPAPGLTVRSFVDMWFMLKLRYTGTIVYYNQSRDDRTNYFTQLIWADTEYVGCAKIKFFSQELNTVVERLVCNFAPKGNNHGKPVYALGFPATQCPKFMDPDNEYPGLCTQGYESETENVQTSSVSSLLRILELSNNSAKQELDPNNLKQTSSNRSEFNDQRNQKTRHVYLNNSQSYGAIKRDSFHMQNPLNPINAPENFKAHQFTPERGHSRMYHGYQTKIEPVQNFQSTQTYSESDFRRFEITTTTYSLPDHNHDFAQNGRRISNINQNEYLPNSRKFINNDNDYVPNHQCTRKGKQSECCTTHCITNQCTRGQSQSCNSCLKAQPCSSCLQTPLPPAVPSHDLCPCSQTPCPTPSPCEFNMNCPVCPSHNCPTPSSICAKRRAQSDETTQFNYYDLFPNVGVRSGDDSLSQTFRRKHLDNPDIEDVLENKSRESEMSNQVKDLADNLQTSFQRPQDLFGIFYSSERKRRDFDDQVTFKPFWQMDEYNYKRPSELKSLRYTTLGNKRNRKTRKTVTPARLPTESITIKLEDEMIHDAHHSDQSTEKYLSFEELMHLRKLSTLEPLDYEARRIGHDYDALRTPVTPKKSVAPTTKKAAAAITTKKSTGAITTKKVTLATKAAVTTKKTVVTTKAPATTKKAAPTTTKAATTTLKTTEITTITPNTPFIRLKQCTRKLTCTWTAIMMTGPDGNAMPGGGAAGMMEFGSKTPPGYVDGCTRTSTCTRDFMDRNKMASTFGDDFVENSAATQEDEDYCEKRSLDLQRRNLDDTDKILNVEFQEAVNEMTPFTPKISHVTNRGIADTEISQKTHSDCICNEDYSRFKRADIENYAQALSKSCNQKEDIINTKSQDTHDNLLNPKLRKKLKPNKIPHRCACNEAESIYSIFHFMFLFNSFFFLRGHIL